MKLGVDVSEHQPAFDFAGFDFAILRTSYGTYRDHAFAEHLAGARSAGIDVAAYHYLRSAEEGTSIKEQVDTALAVMGEDPLPVWIDVESPAGLTLDDVAAARDAFSAAGVAVEGIYTTARYWRKHMLLADAHAFGKLWLAHWGTNPVTNPFRDDLPTSANWPSKFGMPTPSVWQFTSRGRVGAVEVDLNLAQ